MMSTLSMTYLRMSSGVAGLKTRPDLQPVERASWSVRSTCFSVDGVLVAMPRLSSSRRAAMAWTRVRRQRGERDRGRQPKGRAPTTHDAIEATTDPWGARVERDVRGPGVREVLDDAVDGRDHEVTSMGAVTPCLRSRADHGADRQVGHVCGCP